MDILDLEEAIQSGNDQFVDYINRELEKGIFDKTFWKSNGEQTTILNYLISTHSNSDTSTNTNRLFHIEYLLKVGASISIAQPLHYAFKLKKLDLVSLMLSQQSEEKYEKEDYDRSKNQDYFSSNASVNARDIEGCTLLYWAIQAGDRNLLCQILKLEPNVNEANFLTLPDLGRCHVQPLHQAIIADFAEGVIALVEAGAQTDNPYGHHAQKPLLLAADLGRIKALEALLQSINRPEDLAQKDSTEACAIDLLCKRLEKKQQSEEAIRGIAMLLCHGAEAPLRTEKGWSLLQKHREALLSEVITYTLKYPELATNFYRLAKNKNNSLHGILYADNLWTRPFHHLLGQVDGLAGKIEQLVESHAVDYKDQPNEENKFTEDEIKFAKFCKLYYAALKMGIFNPYSVMRWKIDRGEVTTWQDVCKYAENNKGSRTERIVRQMARESVSFHESHDNEVAVNLHSIVGSGSK